MCCVIALYENNLPNAQDLTDMSSLNTDGGGISWISGGLVHWKKGLNAKEIIMEIKKGNVTLPLIVHFRIRSSGKRIKELTHPFKCHEKDTNQLEGKTKYPVLFHNGTIDYEELVLNSIQGSKSKLPEGEFSDSRALSYLVARHGINYLSLMDLSGNKFAIMTPKGIQKFGDWHDMESKDKTQKFQASNTYWQKSDIPQGELMRLSQGYTSDTNDYDDYSGYGHFNSYIPTWQRDMMKKDKEFSKQSKIKEMELSSKIIKTQEEIDLLKQESKKTNNEFTQYEGMNDGESRISRKQPIPKRLNKRLKFSGWDNLTYNDQQKIVSSFNTDCLSWSEWGIYNNMIEAGCDHNEIITSYYENGQDFNMVNLEGYGY